LKLLVIGSGAREHVITSALLRDPEVESVVAAPGNAGMAALVQCIPIDVTDAHSIGELATKLQVDLVVVGPEVPLMAGAANELNARGIPCFGPTREAALIEGSKAFCKEVMAEAGVATASAHVCTNLAEAEIALDTFGSPHVVKDDGLAAGKGVVVTLDRSEALAHAQSCFEVGGSVVIEEFLDGPEVSIFGISDGTTVIALQPAQDFKRVGDNDEGPNTGGMGAYSPLPWLDENVVAEVTERVLQPMADQMKRRGTPFVGVLYAGLAMTARGIRVIEFNARFGDPETQVVLSRLATPLGQFLYAAATGQLKDFATLDWHEGYAVNVVVAARGYPAKPLLGTSISGVELAEADPFITVFHAGTELVDGELVTSGGRVLSVTAQAHTLIQARERAYAGVAHIEIAGSHFRSDIARNACTTDS